MKRLRKSRGLLLAIGFALLTGCAPKVTRVEPVAPPPAVAAEPVPVTPTGPSVLHFSDGREGFLITEPASLEVEARADFARAGTLLADGEYEKAIALLEKVIAQGTGVTAPHINLALAYEQTKKPELAEAQLKRALELVPGHPLASNAYGLLLRRAGRFAEARAIYEKSLAVFPEYQPIHKNLGILCDLYLRDRACALEHYEIYSKGMFRDEQVKIWIADLNARPGH